MILRRAADRDAVAVVDIWNRAIRDTTVTFTSLEKTPQTIRKMIADQPVFVAEIGARVVGFATFGPFRPGPGYARTAEHSIYVAPGSQANGVGQLLMAKLEDVARQSDIDSLIAAIGGEATTSRAFHIRIGFVEVGRLAQVGQKFERRHDLILMQKTL